MHSRRFSPSTDTLSIGTSKGNMLPAARALAACGVVALLAGCAGSLPANFGVAGSTSGSNALHITGTVYGGQQAISGSIIQLYTVGTSGNGSASTGLITATPVSGQNQTDANGKFNISGLYNSCNASSSTGTPAGTEVYLVATGGNSGTTGANAGIGLAAALGDCATVYGQAQSGTLSLQMNEATTIAAAYALAPFAVDFQHIGASGIEPQGLQNAFANAGILVSTSTGAAVPTNSTPGVTIPVNELYTLADILAACINTTGSTANGSACGTLFSATGVSTNTFDAAIQIAKNPGKPAIVALYSLVNSQSPFMPTLSSQPKDFSVALTYAGTGNLATPYGIAIDLTGNAWVTNESGTTVTEFAPSGAVLANATGTNLIGPQGIAIDNNNNVWVASTASNYLFKFASGSTSSPTSYNSGITAPTALAIDHSGDVWIANFNGNSVTEYTSAGALVNTFTGNNNITVPTGLAISPSGGNVLVSSGNGSVVELNNSGTYVTSLTDGALQGPVALAYGGNYLAVSGFTTGSSVGSALSEFNSAGTALSISPIATGLNTPAGVASDGTSFFIVNSATSGSLAQYPINSSSLASPAGGYNTLSSPVGVAIDGSGSIWTTNSVSNTVSKFIGLAVPVATPLVANVAP